MLARRMTIKQIAAELRISQSGVNKHIAALKRRFGVNALSEVVAAWRTLTDETPPDRLSKSACPVSHLASRASPHASGSQKDMGDFQLADSGMPLDWPQLREPQILPRWLEGRRPVLRRLAAIFGIMITLLAIMILAVTVMKVVSEMVSGTKPDLVLRDEAAD